MAKWRDIEVGEIMDFNPKESIKKGVVAKKIPMANLIAFQRKIEGFEHAQYSAGPKFRNGDTLLAKITPCLENGKTAYVDILDENEVAFGSSEFIVLRANEKSDKDFVFYLAKSPVFRRKAISCMEGTSGRKRVNETALKGQVLPVPDIITQKLIGQFLSTLDAKIELNNKINAELEGLAKLVYDYWFVQFDFPNGEGKPYRQSGGKLRFDTMLKRELPEKWEVKELNKIVAVSTTSVNPYTFPERDFKHFSIPNFDATGSYLVEKGATIMSGKFVVTGNDVLVSKLNPWFNRVICPLDEDDMISSTEFVVWRTKNRAMKNFLYMLAKSERFINFCTPLATGTSNSHKRIPPKTMMKFELPFDEKVILKYGETIDNWLRLIENNRKENVQLKALRDWLLPLLMNGQVGVK